MVCIVPDSFQEGDPQFETKVTLIQVQLTTVPLPHYISCTFEVTTKPKYKSSNQARISKASIMSSTNGVVKDTQTINENEAMQAKKRYEAERDKRLRAEGVA